MRNQTDTATLKWICGVAGRKLLWPALLMLVRILQGLSCLAYAYGLKQVVDCAQAGIETAFYRQLGLFIILVLLNLILQASGRYCLEKSKAELDKAFRMHTFSQLLRRDFARVCATHTGEWMNRFTSDTAVVSAAVATILPELTGAAVRMVGAFVSLLQVAPGIVYILLPCSLVMMVFSYFIRKWLKYFHKEMQRADGRVRSFVQEQLSSLLVVRAFSQEDASETMASQRMNDLLSARMRRFRFVNLSNCVLSTAVNGAQVLGIGLCGWGILRGRMSYGTMSSALYLINLMEAPLATVSGYLAQYYTMVASAERLMEVEAFEPDLTAGPVPEEAIRQYYREKLDSLGLSHTCFSYPEGAGDAVLQDFSMHIRKGEFVAFTGESGCGKSTALKVLLNLFPLQSGSIYLQEADGTQRTLDSTWRGLFAYVPQGNLLISGTVREAITFGRPALMAREKQLHKALRIACAEDFVMELPDGLDTVLGERGSGLSEGQMQRLSVARAILSQRPILLLDEATSALDAATETQLLKNLRAMTNVTVLIVTHREAALNICDKRIHFEKGSLS